MIHIQASIRIARQAHGGPIVSDVARLFPAVARGACPAIHASYIAGRSSRLGNLIDETIMVALAVLPAAMSTAIIASAFGWNLVR